MPPLITLVNNDGGSGPRQTRAFEVENKLAESTDRRTFMILWDESSCSIIHRVNLIKRDFPLSLSRHNKGTSRTVIRCFWTEDRVSRMNNSLKCFRTSLIIRESWRGGVDETLMDTSGIKVRCCLIYTCEVTKFVLLHFQRGFLISFSPL